MALDYTEFQDLAVDLLGDAGRQISIRRASPDTTADTSKPWRAEPGAPTFYKVFAVFTSYSTQEVDRSNNRIQASDLKVLVPARDLKIEPTTRDRVVDGSKEYQVMAVKPLKPGPLVVTYELQVREG